jgi:protein subunit release factor A
MAGRVMSLPPDQLKFENNPDDHPGGMRVVEIDAGVRVIWTPPLPGVRVTIDCRRHREQHRNKSDALAMLELLAELEATS